MSNCKSNVSLGQWFCYSYRVLLLLPSSQWVTSHCLPALHKNDRHASLAYGLTLALSPSRWHRSTPWWSCRATWSLKGFCSLAISTSTSAKTSHSLPWVMSTVPATAYPSEFQLLPADSSLSLDLLFQPPLLLPVSPCPCYRLRFGPETELWDKQENLGIGIHDCSSPKLKSGIDSNVAAPHASANV